jgi:hypothetical protein
MEAGPKKVKIKRISPLWSRTHRDANEPKNATTTSLSQKSFLIKKFRWWLWGGGGEFLKKRRKSPNEKPVLFLFFYFFGGKNCFSLRWQLKLAS